MTGFNACMNCGHLPHTDRECRVSRVEGPAADNPYNKAHLHEGRTVTPCGCTEYGYVNGVAS